MVKDIRSAEKSLGKVYYDLTDKMKASREFSRSLYVAENMKAGDVITAIEGKDIATVDDLNKIIHSDTIGQQVAITYYRGTAKNTVSLTLDSSPPPNLP